MAEAVVATTFADLLTQGAEQATGCLHVEDESKARSGRVFYNRSGKVYAVHVDGFLPRIGQRLVTAGLLDHATYADVLRAINGDDLDPKFGAVCVERGLIDQQVLDAIHRELLLSAVGAMLTWPGVTTKFRKGSTTEQFTVNGVTVGGIVKAVNKRTDHWKSIWFEIAPTISVVDAVPVLNEGALEQIPNSPDAYAIVNAINGERNVDEIAGECGLTRFETGHLLHALAGDGLLKISKGNRRASFAAGANQLVPETTSADGFTPEPGPVESDYVIPVVPANMDPMRVPPVRKRPAPLPVAPEPAPEPESDPEDELLLALSLAAPPVADGAAVSHDAPPVEEGPVNLANAPLPLAPAPTVPADAPAELAAFFGVAPTAPDTDDAPPVEDDAPASVDVDDLLDLDALAPPTGPALDDAPPAEEDVPTPAVAEEDPALAALSKVEEAERAAAAAADAVRAAQEEAERLASQAAEAIRLAQEAAAAAEREKLLAELRAETEMALAEERRAVAERDESATALLDARDQHTAAEESVQRAQVRTSDAEKDRRVLGQVAEDANRALEEAEAEVVSATDAEAKALEELQRAQRVYDQACERLSGAGMSVENARSRNANAVADLQRVDERLIQATDALQSAEQEVATATDVVGTSEGRLSAAEEALAAAQAKVAEAKARLAEAEQNGQ